MTAAETQFYEECQVFMDQVFEEWPVVATWLGDHRFDNRLSDFSQGGHRRQRAFLGRWLEKFQAFNPAGWSLDGRIDRTLMVQTSKNLIRGFDALRVAERYPAAAVDEVMDGIYMLIVREHAPLPERMKNILGRLGHVPRILAEGRTMVKPAEVPLVWAGIALETTRQGVGLFASFLPALAAATPDLQGDVTAAAQAAAAALQEHADWIEKTVMPQAAGQFAAGKELFNEILREDHMVDYDADLLLATGWKLLDGTRRQMDQLAAQMAPGKTVAELLEESKAVHPTAEGLLDAYRQKMAEARQFVIDHEIVTIPAEESIRIEPTPAFLRPIIPYAAYTMPGFLDELQEGVFIVTPVEEDADPKAAEAKLRGHPLADIPLTSLHEAYPGHHLQLVVANQVGSLPRKVGGFLSTLFVEGWAFYCEELMEQLGFISEPIQQLARLQAQLWRAARIVLDVSLHTGQIGVDDAAAFLVDKAGLEPDDARTEVLRYTLTPTQPQSYLMGKLEILRIVDAYKSRHPEATMREMHDAILSCGSLPPKLMRLRLFGA